MEGFDEGSLPDGTVLHWVNGTHVSIYSVALVTSDGVLFLDDGTFVEQSMYDHGVGSAWAVEWQLIYVPPRYEVARRVLANSAGESLGTVIFGSRLKVPEP